MTDSKRLIIEVAAFTPNAAEAAFHAGADRVELCSGFAEGGLSPSAATIIWVRERISIPLHVMLRPRIGDFVYNVAEKEIILRDIQFCKDHKVDGIVAGALDSNGEIDEDFTTEMVKVAHPLSFTFHRAFDLCANLADSLETLIRCGVHRVLTSGGEAYCMVGLKTIAGLLDQAADRIIILPGGGIIPGNVRELLKINGISEIHLSGKKLVQSEMRPKSKVSFTSKCEVNDYHWYEFDPEVIGKIRENLKV